METGQIVLYIVLLLIGVQILRRIFLVRSIKQYSPIELSKKMKNSREVVLLDVRTPAERKSQSIKNSLHIPLAQLTSRIDELAKFKNKEIVCCCQTGSRSISAASKLKHRGFITANLKGGIIRWNTAEIK